MKCPKCRAHTVVIDSRYINNSQNRRRECTSCSYRFTTVEVIKADLQQSIHAIKKLSTLVCLHE